MATSAAKKPSAVPPSPPKGNQPAPAEGRLLRAIDRTYRFLASLKLAVISLLGLASLLGVATWVESRYGAQAAGALIYRSPAFAIVLAFLATNILCAALIRYPWTKRQTGFVITHVGLLVVLAGALVSYLWSDEGIVGLMEGEGKDEPVTMIRDHASVIRVRPFDTKTGTASEEYVFAFEPGRWASVAPWSPGRHEVLTRPGDPFKLAVKSFMPISRGHYEHEPAEGGAPMIKVGVQVQPPGALRPIDPFEDDDADKRSWLVADNRLRRAATSLGPAKLAFQSVDSAEMVEDFLDPPKDPIHQQRARLHYVDRGGQHRVYEWPIETGEGKEKEKSVTLPESDLTATFVEAARFPNTQGEFADKTGWESGLPFVLFRVRKGGGPELDHYGWASLPTMPTRIPGHHRESEKDDSEPLLRIDYFHPPEIGGSNRPMGGKFGLVEVVGTADGRLYYRVFGRDGLRSKGPLAPGTTVQAFGGGPNQPMSLSFKVEQYLRSGRERFEFLPATLDVGELEFAVPACMAELTVGGETREVWLQRVGSSRKPEFTPVRFSRGVYELSFDVDRKPLGFNVELKDFHAGVNPGTQDPSSFESQILLSDEERGIKDKPITISMNEPMTHRGYTFYQSRYEALKDPETGMPSGQFLSVFQVGTNPGRGVTYAGCILVVLGAFVQFYMRAGIFTDGGKKERAQAEARAASRRAKVGPAVGVETVVAAEGGSEAGIL